MADADTLDDPDLTVPSDPELKALKDAMDALDFDTARDLATNFVRAHPDRFTDYVRISRSSATEADARQRVIDVVERMRGALPDQHYLAEAWQLHRWDPLHIGGHVEPTVRNEVPAAAPQPAVRNHQ